MSRRGLRWSTAAAGVALCLGAATACSSSGGSGSDGATAASSVIKLGMISDVGTANVNFTDAVAAAKGAVRGVNKRGGLDGHQVQLVFCNEAMTPNKAVACARQMVQDKVLAVVGSFVITAESTTNEILRSAGIPNIGPNFLGSTGQDPNSYLLVGGQTFDNAACITYAISDGLKHIDLLLQVLPTTAPFPAFYKKAIPALGGTMGVTANQPTDGFDLGPEAAQLADDKPGVVNENASGTALISLVPEMVHLGYQGKFVVTGSTLTAANMTSLGSEANRLLFVSQFPPTSAAAKFPGLRQFLADMRAEKAAGDQSAPDSTSYVNSYALDAYTAVIATAKIATAAKAVTPAALKTALNSAKNVNLGGLIPPWTPSKSLTSAVPRVSNGAYYFYSWTNGAAQLKSTTPVDVTKTVNLGQ